MVVVIIIAIFFFGYHIGAKNTAAGYERKLEKQRIVAQVDADKRQAAANEKAKEYEDARTLNEKVLTEVKRSLKNEQNKVAAYRTCHAGAEFLSIYKASATKH